MCTSACLDPLHSSGPLSLSPQACKPDLLAEGRILLALSEAAPSQELRGPILGWGLPQSLRQLFQ